MSLLRMYLAPPEISGKENMKPNIDEALDVLQEHHSKISTAKVRITVVSHVFLTIVQHMRAVIVSHVRATIVSHLRATIVSHVRVTIVSQMRVTLCRRSV